MGAKWTMRQSGEVRATIRVRYEVPRKMVDWLQAHQGWTETKALRWINAAIHNQELADGWHSLAEINGEVYVVHVDDEDTSAREDWDNYYVGPGVI